jgi:hypothetical protein
MQEKRGMATARGMNSFLKVDFLACPPKRHRQGLPRRTPGFLFYDMGARPHMSCIQRWPEARRRRIIAQGACNRLAITRPSTFATTSGQKGEPPRREHATAPRLHSPLASLQPVVQPLAWGPGPTCHTSGALVPGCRKAAPPLAPILCLLEAVAEG